MSLSGALTQLAAYQAKISGVADAEANPREGYASLPCFINYPSRGTITNQEGMVDSSSEVTQVHGLHTITSILIVARGDIAVASATAIPIIAAYYKKVWEDITWASTIDSLNAVRYVWPVEFPAGSGQVACIFEQDVKILEDT